MHIKGKFKMETCFQIIATFMRSGAEVLAFANVLGMMTTIRVAKDGPQPNVGEKWLVRAVGDFVYDPEESKSWITAVLVNRVDQQVRSASASMASFVSSTLTPSRSVSRPDPKRDKRNRDRDQRSKMKNGGNSCGKQKRA
jgi:hypothetical protein